MPSSRYLAKDVVKLLGSNLHSADRAPVKILELGPGNGIFTGYILNHLNQDDHLDVVELNPHFVDIINKKYSADNLHVHHCDFLKFETSYQYDYIFSSIPYEQIHSRISKKIWERKLSMCRDGTYITYYKYINFNRFRCKFEKELVSKYRSDEKVVYLNMPPAKLFTLQINDLNNEDSGNLHEVA
ncbi:MAG: rRNA adenine N-6-methyltransferase family protein [Balneolales bacterium]